MDIIDKEHMTYTLGKKKQTSASVLGMGRKCKNLKLQP